MDQELKSITIKSLIENLTINNKYLTKEDISYLQKKFITSSKRLKDIENQINYEIAKLEKKRIHKEKQQQKIKEDDIKEEIKNDNISEEYSLFSYEKIGISSSKKVKIEKVHLGEQQANKPVHVIVNNKIKGYLKMKDNGLIDIIDLTISQIGKLLDVSVTDIYRVEDEKHNKGILSVDILNDKIISNKTIGEIINSHYNKVLTENTYPSWIRQLLSLPSSDDKQVISDEVSLKTLIELPLDIIYEEYKDMTQDDKDTYKKAYFKMLIFDYLTNQLDRNSENFGISITKENKVILSPLYDNGCVIDTDNLEENTMRFMMKVCDRSAFIQVLFKYYFDEIKEFVIRCTQDREVMHKIDTIIDTYLDENDALWYKGVIDLNRKQMIKWYKKKIEEPKEKLSSSGYVRTVQYSVLIVVCCIILGFVIGLYFVIKTK